ncbi:KDGP aldolase [Brevibacillus humidisoli]|uniref:KDGP aldolase n=1 Tax=Brevibacillus humidisoli TaxID=2895522 RepID=UPI001E3C4783|nr:KDGP aldolase [Brevibacillus humidisoli]UFJ39100.1 KDGP aldolase [Brevibacillus humidisoli]
MTERKQQVRLNVLARDVENAKAIVEETEGNVLIGLMVKPYPTVEAAVDVVRQYQQAKIPVSVGLGAGDPSQWAKVAEVAERTKPEHVNQVFPAAGYTLARLQSVGSAQTIVNALITPSGTPGNVIVSTGPQSQAYPDPISCDAACAMLAEMGIPSVKFYPINGVDRLDEVVEMVKAAVRHQIRIFEPTGGIDVQTIGQVVQVCLENGMEQVIPHVYTAIVDKSTGLTRIEDIRQLLRAIS